MDLQNGILLPVQIMINLQKSPAVPCFEADSVTSSPCTRACTSKCRGNLVRGNRTTNYDPAERIAVPLFGTSWLATEAIRPSGEPQPQRYRQIYTRVVTDFFFDKNFLHLLVQLDARKLAHPPDNLEKSFQDACGERVHGGQIWVMAAELR